MPTFSTHTRPYANVGSKLEIPGHRLISTVLTSRVRWDGDSGQRYCYIQINGNWQNDFNHRHQWQAGTDLHSTQIDP